MSRLADVPEYVEYLETLSAQHSLPPGALMAIMQQESRGGDPRWFKSEAGAVGPFQFLPSTADQYNIDPHDPISAANGAAMYLQDSVARYNGDFHKAALSYHGGPDQKQWGPKTRGYAQRVVDMVFPAARAAEPTDYDRMSDDEVIALGKQRGLVQTEEPAPTYDDMSDEEVIALGKQRGFVEEDTPVEQPPSPGLDVTQKLTALGTGIIPFGREIGAAINTAADVFMSGGTDEPVDVVDRFREYSGLTDKATKANPEWETTGNVASVPTGLGGVARLVGAGALARQGGQVVIKSATKLKNSLKSLNKEELAAVVKDVAAQAGGELALNQLTDAVPELGAILGQLTRARSPARRFSSVVDKVRAP